MSHDTTYEALGRATLPAGTGIRWPQRLAQNLRSALQSRPAGALDARSRARDAAEVREMARRLQDSEPGFASDLLAAADRHEQQFGAGR